MRERLDLPSRLSERQARLAGYMCLIKVMANLGDWFSSDAASPVTNTYVNQYRAICKNLAVGKASDFESALDGPKPHDSLLITARRLDLVRRNHKLDGHARMALQDIAGVRILRSAPVSATRLSELTDFYTGTTITTIAQRQRLSACDDGGSDELDLVASVRQEAEYYMKSD